MTNHDERLRKLAQIGQASAECAFRPDDMPPASVVWSFLLSSAGDGVIDDCALDIYMQDSAPETMPPDFGAYYAEYVERAEARWRNV